MFDKHYAAHAAADQAPPSAKPDGSNIDDDFIVVDEAMDALSTPSNLSASSMQQQPSPARVAWLEQDRAQWRQHVDTLEHEDKRSRVAAVRIGGPTVDESISFDEVEFSNEFDGAEEAEVELDLSSFTGDQIRAARVAHITDVIDKNDMYDVLPVSEKDPAGLDLTGTKQFAMVH